MLLTHNIVRHIRNKYLLVPDVNVPDFLDKLGHQLILTSSTGRLERAFRCLGADLREFLITLDGVYDVLKYQEQDDENVHETAFVCNAIGDSIELHFTTERPAVAYLLVGSLRAIAKTLYNTDTDIEVEQMNYDPRHFR